MIKTIRFYVEYLYGYEGDESRWNGFSDKFDTYEEAQKWIEEYKPKPNHIDFEFQIIKIWEC